MGKQRSLGLGIVFLMVAFLVVGVTGTAFADDQNGPNPPAVGDPIAGNVSPHGGYSTSTNYCMQCHGIHSGTDYSLLRASTVEATCNTCHSLYTQSETGAFNSTPYNPTGASVGTASDRSVYQLGAAGSVTAEHEIGENNTNGTGDNVTMYVGGWSYGWRSSGRPTPQTWPNQTTGNGSTLAQTLTGANTGLNCASCHTPHGGPPFGQAVNTRWVLRSDTSGALANNPSTVNRYAVANNTAIWTYPWDAGNGTWGPSGTPVVRYLWNQAGTWELCEAVDHGGACNPWVVADQEGQKVYAFGYKLLSANPNATWAQPRSWGADYRLSDQTGWCGRCHPNKVDSSAGGGNYGSGTAHSHPTACTYCHGNSAASLAANNADFPHQSATGALLKDYPDGLCVGSCHTGGLP